MVKRWHEFIREFVENSNNIIDIKMQELRDLIDSFSNGQNIIYEWENMNDHQLDVAFSYEGLSIKYEFDIDQMKVTKISGDVVDFTTEVESIDEGLDVIEKDIHFVLGVSESYSPEYDSSLSEEEVREVVRKIRNFAKIEVIDNTADVEGLVEELQKSLSNYDKETIDLVIDTTLFGDDSDNWEDWAIEQIIQTGDKIMSKHGTEPTQILNAYDNSFQYLRKYFRWEDDVFESKSGRPRSQRYKGRKIPGKYLTKNPKAMKREIDTYRGKKEYKKDWDADYKSGKGGKGKRVKTKKSAATLAYEKKFKNKE
jgi:hypothetical protein